MVCSLDPLLLLLPPTLATRIAIIIAALIAPIADHHLLIPIPMRIPQKKSKIMSLERRKTQGESIVIPIWVVELVKNEESNVMKLYLLV